MKKLNKGYTLVEMIAVVTIIAIILPTIFSILYVILQQQLKVSRIIKTKQQGDAILTFVKEKVSRNAVSIKDSSSIVKCAFVNESYSSNIGSDFIFADNSVPSSDFNFSILSGVLSYRGKLQVGGIITTGLHDSSVSISNFNISCYKKNGNSKTLVSITYNISPKDNASASVSQGQITLPYQTVILMRN